MEDSIDKHYRMSVLSYEKRERACPICGKAGIVFVCDGFSFAGERDKIRECCKACALSAAGGEEFVWVKTTFPKLREVWKTLRRPSAPACAEAGRQAIQKSKEKTRM